MQDILAREVMDEIVWEMKWDKELEDSLGSCDIPPDKNFCRLFRAAP